ncbi:MULTISPECIES: hypothetical protein [Rhizobium]|uniref:hypothetical protein n=1 Tax=Rhizobium phaseoli TaxID=396 RepID=UPI000F74A0D5|nr:hypothetical protein [Rhizobium phaseoli]
MLFSFLVAIFLVINRDRSVEQQGRMRLFDFLKRKRMPPTIDMASQAADFVRAFSHPSAPIDAAGLTYSEESLQLVDRVLEDFYRRQAVLPDDLHFLASAYVFETARRQFGGGYHRGDARQGSSASADVEGYMHHGRGVGGQLVLPQRRAPSASRSLAN